MASITDWIARQFISDDFEQTSEQVKAAQQAILERQLAQGKQDAISAMELQNRINDTGTAFFDDELGKKGAAGLTGLFASYWWLWLLLALALFVWMGGLSLLKGRLAR